MLLKKLSTLFVLISISYLSLGNDSLIIKRNDSLTLAQAYINLSLTSTYFDSLSTKRISKILPFVESELSTILDTAFIRANSPIYNFSYSLLHYNQAKLLFVTKNNINRSTLIIWKETLDKSLIYNDKAGISDYITFRNKENSFYEFIGLNSKKYNQLKDSIYALGERFEFYFNRDIYPDFKRILLAAKSGEKHYLDSLLKYATLYNLPVDVEIANLPEPGKFKSNYKFDHFE